METMKEKNNSMKNKDKTKQIKNLKNQSNSDEAGHTKGKTDTEINLNPKVQNITSAKALKMDGEKHGFQTYKNKRQSLGFKTKLV